MSQNDQLTPLRHSLAHLLAAAVLELYPEAKNTIGPAIEDGFYYDFDLSEPISEDVLPKIEKRMRQILTSWKAFDGQQVSADEARQQFASNPYKLEMINDLQQKGEQITLYTSGEFTDLCRGGHLDDAKEINPKAFKLTKVSGAYWRGDETKQQLQRIYGVAFETAEQLTRHLQMLEEAKARDHRKLGKELDLFTFSDLVGSGLPLYTPRGTVLIEQIKGYLREVSLKYDMHLVSIPHLAKKELYEISGHAGKFADELFTVVSHYSQEFILKPVNCPHHTQIYVSRPRSYRDLPIRYIEQTMQYRDEKPGQIGGLQRTRGFTVDDGHTFCRADQIEDEVSMISEIVQDLYTNLGLWGKHWVSLSVRDYNKPEAYIGDSHDWDEAESMLQKAAERHQLDARKMEGEAALYGPKLDFMFKDTLGRETQLATIQIDFSTPKRFKLEYIDSDGSTQTPVMIHRAILGSFERFLMLMIEHFAGKFPVWLAPEQLRIATVSEDEQMVAYAQELASEARQLGLRVSVDTQAESVGKKIRAASIDKVPYTVVIGEKELESRQLQPRVRDDLLVSEQPNAMPADNLLKSIANEAKSRVLKSSM